MARFLPSSPALLCLLVAGVLVTLCALAASAAVGPVRPIVSQRRIQEAGGGGSTGANYIATWEVTLIAPSYQSQPLTSVSLRIEEDPTAVLSGVVKLPNGTRNSVQFSLLCVVSHAIA
jgi:hypothetical protein